MIIEVKGLHSHHTTHTRLLNDQRYKVSGAVLQGNPMAFLVEHAGGLAITHEGPVLDIVPTSIHERCPIFLGSRSDIEELEGFLHAKA